MKSMMVGFYANVPSQNYTFRRKKNSFMCAAEKL